MTVYERFKTLTAQQQRLYNNRVMLGNLPKRKNSAPTLKSAVLLAATADDPGNQLQRKDRNFAMDVSIAEFPDASSQQRQRIRVQLIWDGSLIGEEQTFIIPLTPAEITAKFPMTFQVDAARLNVPGPHSLGFKQWYGINSEDSDELNINIDMDPPTPVGKVNVPAEIEAEQMITKQYLKTHGFVLLSCNEWGGAKLHDKVQFRYGKSLPLSRLIDEVERTDMSILPETRKLTEAFIGEEEGDHSLFYVLVDRKGNESLPSESRVLSVILSDPPENLNLKIELHDDDGKILVDDARTPVTVIITYDIPLDGDRALVSVDGQIPINVSVTQSPCVISLPYKYLQNGNNGLKTVPLVYQISRGKLLFPKVPTPKDLTIDLRSPVTVDPENPGLPGSPHPDLLPVNVQGSVTTEANTIRAGDLVAPVDATVDIYKGHEAGQVVSLFVNGVAVPADPANARGKGGVWTMDGSETDATVLAFTIEPGIFQASGNDPATLCHYNVSHTLNENLNRSQNQHVDVYIVPINLPVPKFLHTIDDLDGPTLGCRSIRDDSLLGKVIEVEVPGGEPKLANQDLEFVYQGYLNDFTGGGNDPGAEIPGNTVTVRKTPSPEEARDGFLVKVPYAQFAITNDGWGKVAYSASIDGQTISATSDPTKVTMRISGGTCAI
ncbi:hypothetical protein [Pseudomonas sp. Ant30-3]|uniref:hypothetical protein n=1 Tax=Pseudomonas sp. Ant30-3 TaxID=1488328 RepID=UPI00048FE513|nr:hypothetical protein [Pseudomonas sp. Ant30-3]